MTFVQKFILTNAVTIAVAITIAFLGIRGMSSLNDYITTIIKKDVVKIQNIGRVAILSESCRKNEKNLLLSDSQDEIESYMDVISKDREEMDKLLVDAFELATLQKNKVKIEKLQTTLKEYDKYIKSIVKLETDNLKNGSATQKKAFELSKTKGYEIGMSITDDVDEILILSSERLDELDKQTNQDFETMRNINFLVAFFGLVLAIVIAFFTSRQIAKTIDTVVSNLKKLSDGDFGAKITDTMQGEFEIIKNGINNLATNLNFLIKDSIAMNDSMIIGKLDTRIDTKKYEGDFLKITSLINYTIHFNTKVITDIGDTLNSFVANKLNARVPNENYFGDFLNITLNINNNLQSQADDIWIRSNISELSNAILQENSLQEQISVAVSKIARILDAGIGAIYLYDEDEKVLRLTASFAFVERDELSNLYHLGNGIVGQVGLEKQPIMLKNIRPNEIVISTATTEQSPKNAYTFPVLYKGQLLAVVEIASYEDFTQVKRRFLEISAETLGAIMYGSIKTEETKKLLIEAKDKQEILEKTNVIMEEQQQQLEEANQEMIEQQQRLEEANAQMEEQTQQLKEQNIAFEQSQIELDERATQLELSSKYKSEFLANMSHELRTPLNSIMVLSESFKQNRDNYLSEKDIKRADIINRSGEELLRLINDILDLSKIEAGKMELIVDTFDSRDILEDFAHIFEESALKKELELEIVDNYKGIITNDRNKLSQILRNFVSNALKFTKAGKITIQIDKSENSNVRLSVSDTGIGIAKDKQKIVFEAFVQAEGGTSREYGGTGLGLSISRELAKLLGGHLGLTSEVGKGSTFSVTIPNLEAKENTKDVSPVSHNLPKTNKSQVTFQKIHDDRDNINQDDKIFLVVEDEIEFAEMLKEKINKLGNKTIIATTGEEALVLAPKFNFNGILLDLKLPDIDGIDILKEFKTNISLKTIPVHIVSAYDKDMVSRIEGAIGFIQKPITEESFKKIMEKFDKFHNKKIKDLLIVEDEINQREALIDFIGNGIVKSTGVATVLEAITEIKTNKYDAVIIDLGLGSGSGLEICDYVKSNKLDLPIIIYTGKDLSADEEKRLKTFTDSIIVKSVASGNRLLKEIDMFLHRVRKDIKLDKKSINEIDFSGSKILAVDDDIRNIYVLTDLLEDSGASIITASNGKEALQKLKENPDINLVLMDIMMPELNGLDATREIRKDDSTKNLPVIALTAKAMPQDRQDALDAGCNDYVTKPIKSEILLAIIDGWLKKSKW